MWYMLMRGQYAPHAPTAEARTTATHSSRTVRAATIGLCHLCHYDSPSGGPPSAWPYALRTQPPGLEGVSCPDRRTGKLQADLRTSVYGAAEYPWYSPCRVHQDNTRKQVYGWYGAL